MKNTFIFIFCTLITLIITCSIEQTAERDCGPITGLIIGLILGPSVIYLVCRLLIPAALEDSDVIINLLSVVSMIIAFVVGTLAVTAISIGDLQMPKIFGYISSIITIILALYLGIRHMINDGREDSAPTFANG